MKKIAVSLSYPLCTRNFIHSGLLNNLAKRGFEIKIISPYVHKQFEDAWGNRFDNTVVPTIGYDPWGTPLIEGTGFWHKLLFSIRLRGYSIEYPNGSLQTMDLSKPDNFSWYLAWMLVKLFPRKSRGRRILRRWYDRLGPNTRQISDFFAKERPDLLITSTMGHLPMDFVSLTIARRFDVKTTCILLSWDNLYSRGPVYKHPDLLLVWSNMMVQQAVEVHQFSTQTVKVVGPLQFVHYAGKITPEERAIVREKFKLAEGEPYILFVCGARTPKYDMEDIHALVKAVSTSIYKDHRIIVRPHPQVDGRKYDEISHLVDIDYSPNVNSDPEKLFTRDDVRYMASLLSQSAYVVSSWGTTALLEACLFDRKIVQLNWYDSVSHSDEWQRNSVRKFQHYYHMLEFDSYAGRLKSESPADLVSKFRELDEHDSQFAVNRERIKVDFTTGEFDRVNDKIATAVEEMLKA